MLSPEQEHEIMDDFHKEMIAIENKVFRKNQRLLNAIKSVKGEAFHKELEEVIYSSEGIVGVAEIVKTPVGNYQDEGGELIPGIWVDQTTNGGYTGDEFAGTVCVKIDDRRYFKFNYSM